MNIARNIVSELPRYQGDIYREISLPDHRTWEGAPFQLPGNIAGTELVIALLTDLVLKKNEWIRVECAGSKSCSGPFREDVLKQNIAGPETFLQGAELARFVSFPADLPWRKLTITANGDFSPVPATVYLVRKG